LVDPDAELFYEGGCLPDGTQGYAVAFGLDEQVVAGLYAHFFSERFGKDDTAGLVNGDFGSHQNHSNMGETNCKWQICDCDGDASWRVARLSRYRTMLQRERSGGAAKIGHALAAEGIEVEGRGGRRRDGEIAGAEGVFESCRAGGESGVGVEAVEGVVFGLGEGDELEAAGAIEVEELGKHFGVEGTDVHEKDVGDVAVVESLGELAVINNVGTGR